jgi:hypothetical protein
MVSPAAAWPPLSPSALGSPASAFAVSPAAAVVAAAVPGVSFTVPVHPAREKAIIAAMVTDIAFFIIFSSLFPNYAD